MVKVLALSLYGTQAASPRYRLMQYAPGLRAYGIELSFSGLLGNDYLRNTFQGGAYSPQKLLRDYFERMMLLLRQREYDLAILHLELFPFMPGIIESRLVRIPYIYDLDDAFFLKYRSDRFGRISFLLKNKFDPVLSRAAAVMAGNNYLADYARRWNPKTVLAPTVVDTDRYKYEPFKEKDIFTVGWIGSPSTSIYLPGLIQPLADLAREGPVRFVVIGGRCPEIEGVDVVHLPWSEETEVGLINTFDVGVMPLFDDEWAKGKCALKLIQYMACGVPVIASPVGANLKVVDAGCGFFAGTPDEWRDRLRRMRGGVSLRRAMGENGRKRVEELYSLRGILPTVANTINSAAARA
jgi:glycosyltransferase involved in cell wall biosynthesis